MGDRNDGQSQGVYNLNDGNDGQTLGGFRMLRSIDHRNLDVSNDQMGNDDKTQEVFRNVQHTNSRKDHNDHSIRCMKMA